MSTSEGHYGTGSDWRTRGPHHPYLHCGEGLRAKDGGESWSGIARSLGITRSEARNVIRFIGKEATEAFAEA